MRKEKLQLNPGTEYVLKIPGWRPPDSAKVSLWVNGIFDNKGTQIALSIRAAAFKKKDKLWASELVLPDDGDVANHSAESQYDLMRRRVTQRMREREDEIAGFRAILADEHCPYDSTEIMKVIELLEGFQSDDQDTIDRVPNQA